MKRYAGGIVSTEGHRRPPWFKEDVVIEGRRAVKDMLKIETGIGRDEEISIERRVFQAPEPIVTRSMGFVSAVVPNDGGEISNR